VKLLNNATKPKIKHVEDLFLKLQSQMKRPGGLQNALKRKNVEA